MLSNYKLNSVWSLCIVPQKKIINGLTPGELQAVVFAYDNNKLEDLYVWSDALVHWTPASQFPDLLKFIGLQSQDQPPLFLFEGSIDDHKSEKDSELEPLITRDLDDELRSQVIQKDLIKSFSELSLEVLNKKILPRKYERIQREFPIEIDVDGQIFRTFTLDISAGGMRIKDELPHWVSGYFTVKIYQSNINESLTHTGWAIENSKRRLHIAFLPFKKSTTEESFSQWLKAS